MKYSACYVKVNPNFVIDNVKTKSSIDKNFSSLFSIAKNIILRGCPTKPSPKVKEILGEPKKYEYFKYVDNGKKLNWDKTIRGGDLSNPALKFYNESFVKSTSEEVLNTFIPECPFRDIINTVDNMSEMYADFYSPELKLVIEVDGSQHNTSKSKIVDSERDLALKRVGVEVIRIPTNLIGYPIFRLQTLTKIYKNENDDINSLSSTDKDYMGLIRYQLLLLSLLETGNLMIDNPIWKFEIVQNEELRKDLFELAFEDLMELIENVANLLDIEIVKPMLHYEIVKEYSNEGCLKVDIDIYGKYSDYPRDDVIYIRNDYFKYHKEANYKTLNVRKEKEIKVNNYVSYKNYYNVSNGDVKYSLSMKNEKHHNSLLYLLKYLFNFDSFNPKQEEIIIRCLNKGAVVGLLPTGAGKSLCYQFSSFLLPGVTLVICPLTILMEDQVDNMEKRHCISNIACINAEKRSNIDLAMNNQCKILIVSPERFFNETFLKIFDQSKIQISFVTVDEVHCISEWGHDFRTSYLCLNYYFKFNLNPKTRVMGLTATASTKVCQDILAEFNTFKKNISLIQADSLNRDNLNLHVNFLPSKEKEKYILEFLSERYKEGKDDKGVVFTTTKNGDNGCIKLSEEARKNLNMYNEINYFAGGENSDYKENSEKLLAFKSGKTKLLFATKAFGMGVDIPDIRYTIHNNLPGSIESLYQEFGRAGRDGNLSDCYINYSKENSKVFNEVFNFKGRQRIDKIDSIKHMFNEFETLLYFMTQSYLDIDVERSLIIIVYKFLDDKSKLTNNVSFSFEELKQYLVKTKLIRKEKITTTLIDKFLYRLYILNLIEIWGITYSNSLENPVYINIKVNEVNVEKQISAVTKYIRKYKANYEYDGEKRARNVLEELLTWIYDNFVYHKLQSIKNVYELCENYVDSKQLMKSIVDYLVIDSNIEKLIKFPNEYSYWFQVLNGYNSSELKMILARYLELDDDIVSLNYVSGLLRLQLNEFDDLDGKRRFVLAMDKIKTYDDQAIEEIFKCSLEYLSEENKELFVEAVMEIDEEYAYKLNNYINSEIVSAKIILDFSNRIIKLGGDIYDKFRENE